MRKPWAAINRMVWAWAAVAAVAVLPGGPGTLCRGQAPDGPASAHTLLNSAIDCYRRGEYEQADELLKRARISQADLGPAEVNDLNNFLTLSDQALRARREGHEQVRRADLALQKGQTREAAGLLRAVFNNQFLTGADRQQVDDLNARLNGAGGSAATGPTTVRAQTGMPNDVGNMVQPDAKTLLTAARDALKRGDLDQAELLANGAEQAAASTHGLPAWMHPWSDSPTKVRRDVAAARAAAKNKAPVSAPVQTPAGSPTGPPMTQLPPPPVVDTKSAEATENARRLLVEGRNALNAGNLTLAREKAEKARDLKPNLAWSEDNPEKLLADIHRVQTARADAQVKQASATGTPEGDRKENPRVLLRQARQLYAQGKFDEAEQLGRRAAADHHTHWGLFEDTPDKLRIDIKRARVKHDQEQSVRVLAEARKLFSEGKLEEAKSKAYLAQKLHGTYSLWEMGDRPQKLIAEIEEAEYRNRKNHVAGAGAAEAVVKTDSVKGSASAAAKGTEKQTPVAKDDPRVARANELMAEAREHLLRGQVQPAAVCLEKLDQLTAAWDARTFGPPPWSDSLFVLRRDMQRAAVQPPTIIPTSANQSMVAPARPVSQELSLEKARMLLQEARALQRAGKLIEARQKALEAQRTSIAFGPEEDRPEMALIELGSLCDGRIRLLLKHATDCVEAAGKEPDPASRAKQFQAAADDLKLAKQLSDGFGLDSMVVDNKFVWLSRTREAMLGQAAPLPPLPAGNDVVKVAAGEPGKNTPREHGLALLDKARLELRSGQTAQARRMAEEAFDPKYGVKKEAEKLLRSIDIEEFNQSILAANRAADAGFAAFNRQDFAHAARILGAVDALKLSPPRRARFKEILAAAEMQPEALARAERGIGPALADAGKPDLHPVDGGAGKATATDLKGPAAKGDGNLMEYAAGMEEVKFQQMHREANKAQRDAMDRFKAGDADQAVMILQQYLASLDDSGLAEEKVAALRRPVQDRLQKLRTLKAQREFEHGQFAENTRTNKMMAQQALMEKQKHDRVAELMKDYNHLYQDGKYREARMKAAMALELDPENVAASAGVKMAQMAQRHQENKELNDRKEEFNNAAYMDADDPGPAVNQRDPLKVDPQFAARSRKRFDGARGLWPKTKSPKEREIERRLEAPISLNFKDEPLSQVIDDLRDLSGVNVVPDRKALTDAGIELDKQLTLQVDNISLKSALNILLRQAALTYVIKDEALQITTEDNAKGQFKRVTYPVADLVVPVENATPAIASNINNFLDQKVANNGPEMAYPTPYTGPNSMFNGTPVSASETGLPGANPQNQVSSMLTATNRRGQTIEGLLIKLITSSIAPESWSDVGGQGTIHYFPLGLALVVNQTLDIQEQIADLLAALRRLQDLEVAVEMRMITVSESFFERIGLDFDINITNTHANQRYGDQLLTTNFQPFGFINAFTPAGITTGLTAAGTLTPDLGIPIRQSSFALSTPPFGYPYATGSDGGLSLGLAFLSDIQVYMFMEAAQGDRRLNVMQAPKLTMFNGQSANIQIQDFQFFMTNVQPAFTASGQLYFIPQNQPVPLGVQMFVQPVVSADRRYVRMNLNPLLTNLASANVPLLPVQVPVPQVFATGIAPAGQDNLFQIFLQQPTFTQIQIQTTVSVPDGGTVLLGGLKTLSEGRNEFGPPILSKIPYLNRLFKNVGYGRESQSLLIMVTPRIIINEEEEIRQTGGPGGVPEAP